MSIKDSTSTNIQPLNAQVAELAKIDTMVERIELGKRPRLVAVREVLAPMGYLQVTMNKDGHLEIKNMISNDSAVIDFDETSSRFINQVKSSATSLFMSPDAVLKGLNAIESRCRYNAGRKGCQLSQLLGDMESDGLVLKDSDIAAHVSELEKVMREQNALNILRKACDAK